MRHWCAQYPAISLESGFQDIKNNCSLTSTQNNSISECKNLNCSIQQTNKAAIAFDRKLITS